MEAEGGDKIGTGLARRIRVALAQMLVVGGDVAGNLARAGARIAEAAARGADLVVLPECLDIGWTDLRARELAEPIPGATSGALGVAARRHRVWVAAGITERDGDKLRNAAILVDRDGVIRTRHRKINELAFAQELYTPGEELRVVDTEFGRLGLNICADNFIDSLHLATAQIAMGARLIVSPSSWAVPPGHDDAVTPYTEWEEPYQTIGQRHGVPIVGVSNVGPVATGKWAGWACIGRSLATNAAGQIAAKGSYGVDADELLVVDLELPDFTATSVTRATGFTG